ncbi:MAG: carboxypeptidase-like regulatory domain-containing protein [Bacteroidota bacterium]
MAKNYSLALAFLLICSSLFGQVSLSGTVADEAGTPLEGVVVLLKPSKLGAISDKGGNFKIEKVPYGKYKLEVSHIGFGKESMNLELNQANPPALSIRMKALDTELDQVVITGKSNEQLQREQPIKIEVISVDQVMEQSTSLPELINQTSGVKVRQSSGIGSQTTININGLQGNAVRFFKDGIPTDYLGYAFNIGLVPTGSIKNVEIYKGVLPIDLGADALGGAINIITTGKDKQYLDASYEIGSFNTHLVNVNSNFIIPNTKLHVGVSGYYTHSDNDYDFDLDITDFNGNVQTHRINRFHDAITGRFVELNAGVHDTKWADLLDIKLSYFSLDNQVQHGIRITQPFGGVSQSETNQILSLTYNKTIRSRLSISLFGAYSQRVGIDQDLSDSLYNWFGEPTQATASGEFQIRDQRIDRENQVFRAALRYELSDNFNLKVSSTFNSSEQVGEDPYGQINIVTGKQPITIPSTYAKMISGIGLGSSFFSDKLKGETFAKHYMLETEAANFWGEDETQALSHRSLGWGQSFKFAFDEFTYARVSYENATRVPESSEYFGDNLFVLPNSTLEPETSDNINLGFATNLNKKNTLSLEINAYYRDTKNFIRVFPLGLINSINRNSDTQITKGIEANFKVQPSETSSISVAITYQDLRRTETTGADRGLEGSRTPNVPYFFTNLSARKSFNNPLALPLKLNVYGNYLFTEQYYFIASSKLLDPPLFGPSASAITSLIPRQHQVNMGLSCILEAVPLSLNFEAINVLNSILYDDFRIPKPFRNFRFKITYRL